MLKKVLSILFILSLCYSVKAQNISEEDTTPSDFYPDSLKISYLTCGAYDEIWTLYGHAALRVEYPPTHEDWAINYGLFSFHQPFFVLRFMFGKCDYMMGIVPFHVFLHEFSSRGASVFQQELNLTPLQKQQVWQAININYLPENQTYRYNFYFDNCTSRARDIVLDNISDSLEYANTISTTTSYRDLIHSCNKMKPWCRFGNDILLGVTSDNYADRKGQQFLPANLMRDLSTAVLIDSNGNRRHAVKSAEWILPPQNIDYSQEFPLTPFAVFSILLLLTILITAFELWKKKNLWWYDTLLLLVDGLVGLILFLMIFSEHPSVSLNLQILILNPLSLVFLWHISKQLRKTGTLSWRALLISAIFIILALIGSHFQEYAEGIILIPLVFAIRLAKHTYTKKIQDI